MKKNTKRIVIALIVAVVAVGIAWGIKLYIREKDPRWQAAKEIYKVQTALQQVDENATLESMSEVRSFEITSPNNPTIYYYCTTIICTSWHCRWWIKRCAGRSAAKILPLWERLKRSSTK